ncbi:MAG TPA: DUF1302 domain-containing protein [Noviherbaspirillum sp.]|uniref:DUF1302 domain-containing protein n=1 Tax=Noviherbaspirillum sp. TaxID=1926288 RepID=UPI002B472476|nr:DUF1302 domain-containing protein [Noviherbaspirillum sp.]HJV86940.1 DUF1302 domain-containing protein [Noviherbaspirillum sp.]
MKTRRPLVDAMRMRPLSVAVTTAFLAAGNAMAFEFDTGNPDVAVRWDNTVRYNAGLRVQGRDPRIGNYYVADEGDYSIDKGDMVANRLDLLSELDVVFRKDMGFRVSAAAWYDGAYGSRSRANPNLRDVLGNPAQPSYVNQTYSSYTKRYYAGPSGEILDAFVFSNFDAGNIPVKLKAGRHTVFWGESLFLGGALHSVSYAQMPLDLQKGFATPGTEAKELFRPLNQISAQAQVTDSLSLAAQYFLQWEPYRYPEGGTYLGPVDFAFNGPDRIIQATHPLLGPLGYTRGDPVRPKNSGEFGLSARWSPEALDGTLGFYLRRYADKLPQTLVTSQRLAGGFPLAGSSFYNLVYADNIDLFGVSLAKNIGGLSLGAELSYRRNTPLVAKVLGDVSATGVPAPGETSGPRGDTVHGLVNLMGSISRTPLFDSATWAGELVWSHWNKVRSGASLFNAVGYNCSVRFGVPARTRAGDKWDGCATKNYVGLNLSFTPTWFQVLPGVDLSAPLTAGMGLKGNAATTFGGNQGTGNFSLGLGADIYQKYRIDLKYIGYLGHYRDDGTGVVTSQNGSSVLIKDRGFLSLTLKTSF